MENEKETKKVKPSEPKKPTFLEKLLAVQMEMEAATRDSNNPFYKSKYADLNSNYTVSKPVLNKYGLIVYHTSEGYGEDKYIRTIIADTQSDERIYIDIQIVTKEPNNPQALGSAITYARRYGLNTLLAIETEDDDGNIASNKATEPRQEDKKTNPEEVKEVRICPECGHTLQLRQGQYGQFWGCSNYPNCTHKEK